MKYTSQALSKNVQKGVRTPLFDCLTLEETQVILDFNGLKESIARELEIILNTKPTAEDWQMNEAVYQVVCHLPQYFGLRDFSVQQASNELGRQMMAQEVKKVVQAYEPRLKNVQVKVAPSSAHSLSAMIEISGDVHFGYVRERITFPIHVKNLFHHQPA